MWAVLGRFAIAFFGKWFVQLGLIVGGTAALNSEKTAEWLSEHGFKWLANAIHQITVWALGGMFYILKGVLYLVIDGLLTAVKTIVTGIDFSSIAFQWAAGKALLPLQAIYFICAIGFPQFVTIIASAYVIRLILNLIPAAATRV